MKRTFLTLCLGTLGLVSHFSVYAADWAPVQAAGATYVQAVIAGDSVKTAEALISYESLAKAAYSEEKSGGLVTTATVATPKNTVVAASSSVATGKKLYDASCQACHAAGIIGAPKFGDKAAWAPRIAQGVAVLTTHAINGFQGKSGMMPARGGSTASDDEVKAAVAFMVAAAK